MANVAVDKIGETTTYLTVIKEFAELAALGLVILIIYYVLRRRKFV